MSAISILNGLLLLSSGVSHGETPPLFSFVYGGKSSADLLSRWNREKEPTRAVSGGTLSVAIYRDPATGLEMRIEETTFPDCSAVDWVIRFTNKGTTDSPLLEQVFPLDGDFGDMDGDVVLHSAQGSTSAATDFLPVDQKLEPGTVISLAPRSGLSSEGVLPFFNMEWSGGGVAWAVGWSGQWSQQVCRDSAGRVAIKAGQQTLRTTLHPGESIRTPRILLVPWQGSDRMSGHNLLRQAILAHYTPRLDGELVMPPIAQNTWFINNCGNETTEENQLKHIHAMPALGVETFWLDAGWHEGGWPKGIGSWVPHAEHFPRGLKPLGDAAHKLGLNFLLWLAPELVSPGTRIAREHPEFVMAWKDFQKEEGLFNLGDPVARAWLTDYLSKCITEWGVDIWRTDFGGKPLLYWQKKDEDDRQGMTENHYITGLYAMYDELHRRHPRLIFDDCASGGRRIDLELISRCCVLFRSDTPTTSASTSAWDQAQTAGLSLYVPVHATGSSCGIPRWSSQALSLYALRSSATSGFNFSQDNFAPTFPDGLFKQMAGEVKKLRPLYTGDFYPLTEINTREDAWCAWQFNRPDSGKGFAMFFRRPESPCATLSVVLRGLDPEAGYDVTFVDCARTETRKGSALATLTVDSPSAPGSVLVLYEKKDRRGSEGARLAGAG
jgi:alpha-galactosidase